MNTNQKTVIIDAVTLLAVFILLPVAGTAQTRTQSVDQPDPSSATSFPSCDTTNFDMKLVESSQEEYPLEFKGCWNKDPDDEDRVRDEPDDGYDEVELKQLNIQYEYPSGASAGTAIDLTDGSTSCDGYGGALDLCGTVRWQVSRDVENGQFTVSLIGGRDLGDAWTGEVTISAVGLQETGTSVFGIPNFQYARTYCNPDFKWGDSPYPKPTTLDCVASDGFEVGLDAEVGIIDFADDLSGWGNEYTLKDGQTILLDATSDGACPAFAIRNNGNRRLNYDVGGRNANRGGSVNARDGVQIDLASGVVAGVADYDGTTEEITFTPRCEGSNQGGGQDTGSPIDTQSTWMSLCNQKQPQPSGWSGDFQYSSGSPNALEVLACIYYLSNQCVSGSPAPQVSADSLDADRCDTVMPPLCTTYGLQWDADQDKCVN